MFATKESMKLDDLKGQAGVKGLPGDSTSRNRIPPYNSSHLSLWQRYLGNNHFQSKQQSLVHHAVSDDLYEWEVKLNEQTPDSYTSYEPEESPGPVSHDASVPRDAGGPLPGGVPEPEPAPEIVPDDSPCTLTTRTLAHAPNGAADTRIVVGVNEQVEMTCSASADWTASSGTLTPTRGVTVIWTAPAIIGPARVTATPRRGSPCSVSMAVLSPSNRSLGHPPRPRIYSPGQAGSGFEADVTIMPINVSFSRIQVREEEVEASATGYYDTVLDWDRMKHPVGPWITPNANNGGMIDTVGTDPPGTPGPFGEGTFTWPIPQHYRIVGGAGTGTYYSTGTHAQFMLGTSGAEGTSKEGASRGRVP